MIVAALSALSLAAYLASISPEICGGSTEAPGEVEIHWANDFSLSQAATPIAWPDELRQATMVVCKREALIFGPNDLAVLNDLGVPFAVSDGERMLWLYRQENEVRLHMDEGVMTEQEQQANTRMLKRFNAAFPEGT